MTFTKGQLVIFIHKDKLAAGCIEHVYPADNKAVMIQTSGLRQRHIVIPESIIRRIQDDAVQAYLKQGGN